MPTGGTKMNLCVLLTGALFVVGCASQSATTPTQPVCEEDVTTAEVMQAAEKVLTRMQFSIEKLDVEQGILRTRPLRGAQFFEFWRSDNASLRAYAEANAQSIRRSVELRVRNEATDGRLEPGGASSLRPTASGLLCIDCDVLVQRLSLPENEVAGVSQAYRIHSRSTPALQRLEVTPQQRVAMAWMDVGKDPDLAARILRRVEHALQRAN